MKYLLFITLILILPLVTAFDLNNEISQQDKDTFNEILEPVLKIYDFVEYSATILAALFLVFAAINFMCSGDDQRKRDGAKKSIGYTLIGLLIIWAAPLIIDFLV